MSQIIALIGVDRQASMYTTLTSDIVNRLMLLRSLGLDASIKIEQQTFYSHKTEYAIETILNYVLKDSSGVKPVVPDFIRARYHMNNLWEFYIY